MAIICPTVLAGTQQDYDNQIKLISFAPRVQLDFMDGEFVETKSIGVKDAWWPDSVQADFHLMYAHPDHYLADLLNLKPRMVIVHAEADIDHEQFAKALHEADILTGLCVLPETGIDDVKSLLGSFDHLLIFGGHLGHFGGTADLTQLKKADEAKRYNPNIEIGWDGGVTDTVAKQLAEGGVDVINVGSFIHKADNPAAAYQKLVELTR